jgi:hypothetical protein
MAIDDATDLGVDSLEFIPCQGLHSICQPVLRLLTIAALLWLGYESAVDPKNNVIVKCPMKTMRRQSREIEQEEVRTFVAKHPDIPPAAVQMLFALADHHETVAVQFAELIRRGLERSEADVAPPEQREYVRRQNAIVFTLQDEFSCTPASVVKRVVMESNDETENARFRLNKIAKHNIDVDSLREVIEVLPNAPIEKIIAEIEEADGNAGPVMDRLVETSALVLQNAQAVFAYRPRLKCMK